MLRWVVWGFTDPFSLELNKFLDDFLLSRLGCNMLMGVLAGFIEFFRTKKKWPEVTKWPGPLTLVNCWGQYLACTNHDSHITSIVNQCDALDICRKAAEEVPLGTGRPWAEMGRVPSEIHVAWDKYGQCQVWRPILRGWIWRNASFSWGEYGEIPNFHG